VPNRRVETPLSPVLPTPLRAFSTSSTKRIAGLMASAIRKACRRLASLWPTRLVLIKADGPRRLMVRVVHARQETKGWWIIGCAFARPLSEEELQTVLDEQE